jgi:hypothetical protein
MSGNALWQVVEIELTNAGSSLGLQLILHFAFLVLRLVPGL